MKGRPKPGGLSAVLAQVERCRIRAGHSYSADRPYLFSMTVLRRTALRLATVAVAAAVIAIALPAQRFTDSTIVSGSIVGFDGRIPPRADVELIPVRATNRAVRARVGADGTFRVTIAGAGPFRLRAGGVGYLAFQRAIPVTAPTTLRVAVTLAGMPHGLAKGPLIGIAAERDAEKPRPDMPPAMTNAANMAATNQLDFHIINLLPQRN